MERTECTLVSASCTTGWTDWIHGELWVCHEGIFRRSLGLRATIAHGSGPTVDPVAHVTQRLSPTEIAQATSERRNHWVPWNAIAHAELRHGFLTDSLHLRLQDGRRRKFLWLAVDQADAHLAKALEQSIGNRFAGAAPADSEGTRAPRSGDEETADAGEWPLTLMANWVDSGVDLLELRSAIVLLAAGIWAAAARLILDGRIDVRLVGLAILAGAWIVWRAARYRPVSLEMSLSSHSARVRETGRSRHGTYELARERAGWLTAGESGLDWHDRLLGLTDDAGRQIGQFRARPARVQVRTDSAEGEAWVRKNLPVEAGTAITTTASVTALLGTWWPHPDRRVSIRGNMAVRRRWTEPNLRDYPAWDRRQRRLYAAVFGVFMLFFVAIGTVLPSSLGERIAILPLAVGGLALAIRNLIR